ncbi:hypothetical protein COLO4_04411 [Corchorus olitorius]|uniref:Uncharacterized protein n=1 Tax=Corchorus olitorius TaxID=93759 RepID=A0A1R3KU19_9ROSI|nr:hypothetical protein COLO4_04411 [Corchorus olitorius]
MRLVSGYVILHPSLYQTPLTTLQSEPSTTLNAKPVNPKIFKSRQRCRRESLCYPYLSCPPSPSTLLNYFKECFREREREQGFNIERGSGEFVRAVNSVCGVFQYPGRMRAFFVLMVEGVKMRVSGEDPVCPFSVVKGCG